jgi:hypothetical protein
MTAPTKRITKPAPASTHQGSVVFDYLDQQVAKDMVGFYSAFGLQAPGQAVRSSNSSAGQRKTAKR